MLNLIFGIFLSRLLTPADYGVVGALTIFSATAGIFAESGFILAIVNKKEATDDDFNAMFWFNMVAGLFFYWLLFFLAPAIAGFYRQPEMTALSRFLFLSFVAGCTSTAPIAYMFRNLMVKERSQIQIIAVVLSGLAGVTCAFNGMGYWGIAIQTVLYSSVTAVLAWLRCPWRPRFSFKYTALKSMLPFSMKQMFTTLFTHINNNIFSMILGRFYTMRETGFYTQGSKWTTMGWSTIHGMINNVGQPVLRQASDDMERLRRVFLKLLRFTAFISFPAMFGLGITARELIVISITDKWVDCVPVMQILCLWGAFVPIVTLYTNLFNSLGRPGIYMWNTITLGLIQLIVVVLSYSYGLNAMLLAYTSVNLLWLLVWQYFAHKHTGLRLREVVKAIAPYLIISVAVMAVTVTATRGISQPLLSLVTKIALAAAIYILLMWKLDSVVFREAVQYLFKKKDR